ncbi:MFS transporter [Paracoccus sp. (in: a-proteobacteria)]|uniref:MFS transporter n=1 Tax=Paracoccus sp. TaxID=267 RepID=UPI00396CB679
MTQARTSTGSLMAAGFGLTALAYGLARFAYGLLLPQIKAELDLGTVAAGWIGSAAFAAYCAGVVAAFMVVPKLGARAVAVAAGLCATAGLGLAAAAGSAVFLGGAIALAGISTGLASPPLAAAVGHHVPKADRSRANGAINAGTAAGIVLSGLAALIFAAAWRELYLGFAAIGAAVTLWLWRAIPDGATGGSAAGHSFRQPGLVPLCMAATLMGAASTALWTFGADILREEMAFTDRRIAVAWIVLGATGLAGVVTGHGTERFGIPAVHRMSLAMMGVALLSLTVASWATFMPFAAMGLFGAGYIISSGALLLWGVTLFPDRADLGLGLSFLMVAAGQTAGAPLFALLMNAAGTSAALAGAALLMACAAIFAPHHALANDPALPHPAGAD